MIRFALILAHAGMAFLALSAFFKLADLEAFRASLNQWAVIPPWLQSILTVSVPSLELLISGSWFVGRQRRHALAGLALVGCFTLGFAVELIINPRVKSCGCMGSLTQDTWLESPPAVFVRNGALMAAFAFAAWKAGSRTRPVAPDAPVQPRHAHARSAFTIIEVLCVIVLIGLLAVLIMPTLRIIRDMGRQSVSLSNLRSHAAVFNAYTNDYKEAWPYYTDPDATLSVLRSQRNNIARTVVYFGLFNRWHLAMLDDYYDGQARSAVFNQPQASWAVPQGAYTWNTYQYPCVFLTAHEFWNPRTREAPARPQLRATRAGDVTWPAAKTLLVGFHSTDDQASVGSRVMSGRREFAFVAGHAEQVAAGRYTSGYVTGEGVSTPLSTHATSGNPPGLHTIDGVRGRDVIGD